MADERQFFFFAVQDIQDADNDEDEFSDPPEPHDEPAEDGYEDEEPTGDPADELKDDEGEALLQVIFDERVIFRISKEWDNDEDPKIGENRHDIDPSDLSRLMLRTAVSVSRHELSITNRHHARRFAFLPWHATLLPMDLAVKTREIIGKKVRALRREGLVPAELYGHGIKNLHLSIGTKEIDKALKEAGMTTVVTLVLNTTKHPAIIHSVTRNYLTGGIDHVDFYEVRMDEKIKTKVPLEFVGEAPAVKALGAVINKTMSEVEVEALPQNLPHKLIVDLSTLDAIDKSIYVRDIAVPKGVEFLVAPETAVATATPPAAEEIVEAPAADVSEVKVETEEKKAERAAEKSEKE
jgi:large subunit ribosomal protein L25